MLEITATLLMFVCASLSFLLANLKSFTKEDNIMANVIEVTPNKDGKIFITLYGTKYEIVIKKPVKVETKAEKE